ncbi:major facilitator superfamily domain-containing protein [Zychaea mexicana]|uniref:major facilitator superfamily domain-containing protein n=1 Tax=Zychaea mexicana TaxID=64656 RepID=UPI0022FF233E|nr:major facilitator superfamily domain-containing protein [Zychaea mexicana]KAI9493815.1 major facilitator superfamily domain-containing protein [Zychaea mexicana]
MLFTAGVFKFPSIVIAASSSSCSLFRNKSSIPSSSTTFSNITTTTSSDDDRTATHTALFSSGASIKSTTSTVSSTEEEEAMTELKQRSTVQLIFIMASLFLSLLLVSLDQSIVATALPVIASTFNSLEQVEWVGTAYIVPMTALQPIYGKLADIFGRKYTIVSSIIVFLIGSGFAGSAPNMVVLCVMRGVQGTGAAGIAPLVMITIGDLVPLRERAKYQGLVGLCWATGSIAGPLLGGLLSEKTSWRWIFYINLPIGALALAILVLCLPATTRHQEDGLGQDLEQSWREKWLRVDFVGATLFIATVSCFLLATQWGGTRYPWSSPIILALYSACVLLAILTVLLSWLQVSSREPILSLHLFRVRDQVVTYIMALTFCMAMFMNVYYLPLYFQVAHGDTPLVAGIELLPYLVPVDLVSIVSGYWVAKTGCYRMMFWVGNALVALGGGLQSRLAADSGHVEQVLFLVVTGAGIGFCIQNVYVAAQANAAHSDLAAAISLISFFGHFGFTCGIATGSAIFKNMLVHYLRSTMDLTEQQIRQAQQTPAFLDTLEPGLHHVASQAYAMALDWVFVGVAICGCVGFLASLCLTAKNILGDDQQQRQEGVDR